MKKKSVTEDNKLEVNAPKLVNGCTSNGIPYPTTDTHSILVMMHGKM
jgi:hypothetical protein